MARGTTRPRAAAALLLLVLGAGGVALAAKPAPRPAAENAARSARAPRGGEPTLSSARWFPPDTAVRSLLAARVESGQVPGIVVGLLEADGTMRHVAYGRSGGPGDRPLDGATVFEIGSITKVFTAALLADMVRRGEVRLDQPVAELLPDTVRVPAMRDTPITLLDLATQHSGLPRLPVNIAPRDMANPYADYTVEKLYEFLKVYSLPRPPGAKYEYSNVGVGLLGHALARKAGKSYEGALVERVLGPLGLADTRVTLTDEQQSRFAAGHNKSGAVTANWDFPTLGGAGALRSTANDMLRFLAACLDSNDTPVSADLREARRPRRVAANPKVSIGLAWHWMDIQGAQIVMHNGGTGGFRSFIGYDPAMRVGVVVLANGTGEVDDIGLHLLYPKIPAKTFTRRVEVKIDSTRLEGLVGEYAMSPMFGFKITRRSDSLFVQATGQPTLQVYAESDTGFFYRNVDAVLTFDRDENDRSTRLILHQNSREVLCRKKPQ